MKAYIDKLVSFSFFSYPRYTRLDVFVDDSWYRSFRTYPWHAPIIRNRLNEFGKSNIFGLETWCSHAFLLRWPSSYHTTLKQYSMSPGRPSGLDVRSSVVVAVAIKAWCTSFMTVLFTTSILNHYPMDSRPNRVSYHMLFHAAANL